MHFRVGSGLAVTVLVALLAGCGGSPPATASRDGGNALRLERPRGIAYAADGDFLYVLDRTAVIRKLTGDGAFRSSWRMPAHEKGSPEDLCLDSQGRLLVADTHYSRVTIFSQTGELLGHFGSYGETDGAFIYPVGICVDGADNVYVAEYGKADRIQKFTSAGEHLASWGGFGEAPGQLQRPAGVTWDAGLIYIADSCNHRVQVFTEDGELVRIIGSHGRAAGEFRYPYDVEVADGKLLVLEYGNQRVQEMTLTGVPLRILGAPGRGDDELFLPWRTCIAGDEVVVADTNNNRIVRLPR